MEVDPIVKHVDSIPVIDAVKNVNGTPTAAALRAFLRPRRYNSSQESLKLPSAVSILDDFSNQCFSGSLRLFPIQPGEDDVFYELVEPDFLLVESAWAGNQFAWRYDVAGERGARAIGPVIDKFRSLGVPTVFWNKEDPPHFEEFIETAKLFDFIFTTAGEMLPRYAEAAPDATTDVLQFAASPELHSPSRVYGYRSKSVAFAGQYFRDKYPERAVQMSELFPAAQRFGLEIFSRMGDKDSAYSFPSPFDELVVGSLPYSRMVEAYRQYKVFINVNSVPDSPTMCSRRVFELASSKTVVLSTRSPALVDLFGEDEILFADTEAEAEEKLELVLSSDLTRLGIAQKAWRRVAASHTYGDRVAEMLKAIGEKYTVRRWQVALFLPPGLERSERQRILHEIREQELPVCGGWQLTIVTPESSAGAEEDRLLGPGISLLARTSFVPEDFDIVGQLADARYGQHFLGDLLLTLTKYTRAPAACNSAWGEGKFPEGANSETLVTDPTPGAWIARREVVDFSDPHQIHLAQGTAVYATGPLGFWNDPGLPPEGWDA